MCNCKIYRLLHNIPEIRKGAIVGKDCGESRYKVLNLDKVARYPLTPNSKFTFHQDVVENMSYWFESLDCEC